MKRVQEQIFNGKWHRTIFQYRKKYKWQKRLLCTLFFPAAFIIAIGRKICRKKVLPSSSYRKKEVRTTAEIFSNRWFQEKENILRKTFTPHHIRLHTPDGASLSGVYYKHKEEEKNTPIVLLFQPNGSLVKHGEYEWLLASCQKKQIVASFVSVDYRGCGDSCGKATRASDLVLDGDTLYQYVRSCLQKKDENIFFYGHALGASIGAFVKALYPKRPIKYVNERSFSSVTHLFSIRYPHFGKALSWMMRQLHWELNVSKTWQGLAGEKMIVFQKKDRIIPYSASLYYGLQRTKTRENNTRYVELTTAQPTKHPFHHSLPLESYIDKSTANCAEDLVVSFLFSTTGQE